MLLHSRNLTRHGRDWMSLRTPCEYNYYDQILSNSTHENTEYDAENKETDPTLLVFKNQITGFPDCKCHYRMNAGQVLFVLAL